MLALALALCLGAAPPEVVIFRASGDVPDRGAYPQDARVVRRAEDLEGALASARLLVWADGASFPVEAWRAMQAWLQRGGAWLNLGGAPFSRPVAGGAAMPATEAYLRALGLTRATPVAVSGATLRFVDGGSERVLAGPTTALALEPRFAREPGDPDEEGAQAEREASLVPLAYCHAPGADPRFPRAAAAVAIDHWRGPFAGSRFTLWLLDRPPATAELRMLLAEALRPCEMLRVDPTLACYYAGETPALRLRAVGPAAARRTVEVAVERPDGSKLALGPVALEDGAASLQLDGLTEPGLYRAVATRAGARPVETGFWILDRDLFESGSKLTFEGDVMRRDGRPEPIVGTTLMAATAQREFLFEPNAAEWDREMAAIASLDLGMVRTGLWAGWTRIQPTSNAVDEAFLRALEAFYLTARRHGLPVLFTCFAFQPPAAKGANPYLDPQAIERQRALVGAIAARFAGARELLFDLINEPSFCSPAQMWKCRPNGDPIEEQRFLAWLRERFSPQGDWEQVVRARWRLREDEPIGLPALADFDDFTVSESRRPYRARDWLRFAQDAFADWAGAMRAAIRDSGCSAAITVGQDEGGLAERPHPLFFERTVDFTSMHTWWWNDALLYDALCAKAPGKPLLISETGAMQRELLSGEALRSPDDAARLLERKIAYAFAGRAFGAIQWCWDTNPFMASDNEVAIGALRVDGSAKPELAVLRDMASFVKRNRALFEQPAAPDVAWVLPWMDQVGARGMQLEAGKRALERLVFDGGLAVQVVPEGREEWLAPFGELVLPANRGISDALFAALHARVEAGATLRVRGYGEADDAGLPARRFGFRPRPLALREGELVFPLAAAQSWLAADSDARTFAIGSGRVVAEPLPLEWATTPPPLERRPGAVAATAPTALRIAAIRFRDATLVVAINETARDAAADVAVVAGSAPIPIAVPAFGARMCFVDREGREIDRSGPR